MVSKIYYLSGECYVLAHYCVSRYFLTKRSQRSVSRQHQQQEGVEEEDFNPLEEEEEEEARGGREPGHTCLYLGSVNVGNCGEVDR